MRNLSTELKVGLLIITGVGLIVYSSVVVTGWRPGIGDTYSLYIYFDNAAGLLPGSPVQIAGVKIGQVESIGLEHGQAKITVAVYSSQRLGRDATASIKSLGILGDKYIEIDPGNPASAPLQNGDTIVLVIPGRDLDALVNSLGDILADVRTVTASLRETLGSERGRERLDNIFERIASATDDLASVADATNRDIDTILTNLKRFTGDLSEITAENRDAIGRAVESLDRFTRNLDELTAENRETVTRAIDDLAAFAADLRDLTGENRRRLDAIIANLDRFSTALGEDGPAITNDLRSILAENRDNLNSAVTNLDRSFAKLDKSMANLESISAKMDRGEGSLGKLINDETTVDELNQALNGLNRFLTEADQIRLDMGGHTEYLVQQGEFKSYFTVRLQPLKDRYYMLQLVDNPRGKVEEETIIREQGGSTTTVKETTVKDAFQISLLIAQRYYDTVLRGGLIENSFGVGVDQFFGKRDQYRIGLDVWDFGNDLGPHVKLTGYWRFFSNAFLVVGGDDLINERSEFRDAFFGVGVTFNEDSLKTVLAGGGLPTSALTQ